MRRVNGVNKYNFSLFFLLGITASIFLFLNLQSCKNPTDASGLDTTGTNYSWQKFTFGGYAGSCSLYDVAIIDGNSIWAVGAVYLDSANGNPDPFPYNAVHWDGNKWSTIKIPYYYQGQALYSPIYSIYAFSASDIWFEAGIHWNGHQFETVPLNIGFPSHVNKLWGTSSSDLYIVGNNGLIAHRNADGVWQKLESGTTLGLVDIYGASLPNFSPEQILAVGTSNYPLNKIILSINGNTVTSLPTSPIEFELSSIWFVPFVYYYVAGDGIFEKNSLSDSSWKNGPLDITKYGITKIRGNGLNDIFAVGAFGEVLHYNRESWKSYINETGLSNGSYAGLAVKGDLIVAVGSNNQQAVVLIGRRK